METYLIFAGLTYYPMGGAGDLVGVTDSFNRALDVVARNMVSKDWAHIYSVLDQRIIWDSKKGAL